MNDGNPLSLTPPINGKKIVFTTSLIILFPILGTNRTEAEESNITIVESAIEIPAEAFPEMDFSYVFNHYATNVFFQVTPPEDMNASDYDIVADTEVLGFSIPEEPNITDLRMPVRITLQSLRGRRGEVCS